jgi:hypothetical protein
MSHEYPNQPVGMPQPAGVPDGTPPASAPAPGVGPVMGRRTSVLGAWGARIVLIVVAACALVSVVFILFGAGGDTLGRVVTTDIALIVFALLVWLDTVIGGYRPEWFEFASLATDAYLLLLWIVTIWTENGSGGFTLWIDIWRGILCLIFVRGMLALVDLVRFLYARWVTPVTRVLAYVSGCAFAVIGVMVTIPAPTPFNGLWDHDFYGRIVASVAVIAGVALVLIPLWGLLINRSRGERRAPAYGPAPSTGGYPAGYGLAGYPAAPRPPFGSGVPPVPQAPGYPQPFVSAPATPAAAGPAPAAVPGPPSAPAWPVDDVPNEQTGSSPSIPVVAAGGPSAGAPSSAVASAGAPTAGAPSVGAPSVGAPSARASAGSGRVAEAHASAPHPPLAWPRLANGAPVPASASGTPDFAAVAGAPLAWPTFIDGTPVPAAPDGSPLYR